MIKSLNETFINYKQLINSPEISSASILSLCNKFDRYIYVDGPIYVMEVDNQSIYSTIEFINEFSKLLKWGYYEVDPTNEKYFTQIIDIKGFIKISSFHHKENSDSHPIFIINPNKGCLINNLDFDKTKQYILCSLSFLNNAIFCEIDNTKGLESSPINSNILLIEYLLNKKSIVDEAESLFFFKVSQIKEIFDIKGISFNLSLDQLSAEKYKKATSADLLLNQSKPIVKETNHKIQIANQKIIIYSLIGLLGKFPEYQQGTQNLNVARIARSIESYLKHDIDFDGYIPQNNTINTLHSKIKNEFESLMLEILEYIDKENS